jgi:sulfoxide reductase catalytic subunit YedY
MSDRIPSREITPQRLYANRRAFMRAGTLTAAAVGTGAVYRRLNGVTHDVVERPAIPGIVTAPSRGGSGFRIDDALTPQASIVNYNNFYEFTTDKEGVATAAAGFSTAGWTVAVGGLVRKPRRFDLDDLRRLSPPEERIYRMRCVEAWSMVVPWVGYSLSKLLDVVEPTGDATYVVFKTLLDPERMPGQRDAFSLRWPYTEGLRLDEAMHPLTILATGLYGQELPPQDGAPIRLVVPWRYGFKGIKSIVSITLAAARPETTWNITAPDEYGFYANVNPRHDHPRWSQATEQRIGERGRRDTLPFNGYGDQVARLYAGMNLDVDF